MSYIDVLIPLLGGLFLLTSGDKLVKQNDSNFEQKKGLFKKAGYVLIGVSAIYITVKFLGK